MKKVVIYVEDEILDAIRIFSNKRHISISKLGREALKSFVRQRSNGVIQGDFNVKVLERFQTFINNNKDLLSCEDKIFRAGDKYRFFTLGRNYILTESTSSHDMISYSLTEFEGNAIRDAIRGC